MKTILFCSVLAFAGSALAGVNSITVSESQSDCHHRAHYGRMKDAGTPGTYYRSNFFRNEVIVVNDTSDFVTFFVYFGDVSGPNHINKMIRTKAPVYELVVAPYQSSFFEQRGRCYWVGTTPGKCGIDPARGRIVCE